MLDQNSDLVIIRAAAVKAMTGLSSSSLYELVKAKTFPAPIPLLGPRRVGWVKAQVQAWIVAQVAAAPKEREKRADLRKRGVPTRAVPKRAEKKQVVKKRVVKTPR